LWLSSSARRSGSRAAARLVGPAQRGAEVEQCADVLEARRIPIAGGDGLLEQLEALAAARGEAEHSQVADDDAGDPGGTSLLELLGGQLDGAARIAERRVGEGRGRAPGDPARPDAAEPPLQRTPASSASSRASSAGAAPGAAARGRRAGSRARRSP
jgi:hypothetical protein